MFRHAPKQTERHCMRTLLEVADGHPRPAAELRARAAGRGVEIEPNNSFTPLHRLVTQGSLHASGRCQRRTYARTARGERHLRVLDIALSARLASVLLRVPPEPTPTAALARALSAEFQIHRASLYFSLRSLEDLGLIVRRGSPSDVALTELGLATLPDAQAVVEFVDGPSAPVLTNPGSPVSSGP